MTRKTSHIAWPLAAARREVRSSLYSSIILSLSLAIGVAVLVFSHSLGTTLRAAVEHESKGLLGADLTLTHRHDLPETSLAPVKESPATLAHEVRFRSMVAFSDKESRLVQVRAIEGPFPFYGEVETMPEGAWRRLEERGVLVDETLLAQTGASIGEKLRIGSLELPIIGAVTRTPGESPFSGFVAPKIYLSRTLLPETLLLQKGSIAQRLVYMKFQNDDQITSFLATHETTLESNGIEITTVEKRREMLGDVSRNVKIFFDAVGLLSVILGAATSAATLSTFMRRKRLVVGIMKCLGATTLQIRSYTVLYLLSLAAIGTALGATIGLVARSVSLRVIVSLLKLPLPETSVIESVVVGAIVALGTGVAGWQEMSRLHTVTPLVVFRPSQDRASRPFSAQKVLPACLLFGVSYLWYSIGSFKFAVLITFCCAAGIALLGLSAYLLRRISRTLSTQNLPYTLRQGLRNLSRPGNQTLLLVTSSGLALIAAHSILLFKGFLTAQVKLSQSDTTPNVFIYDIQVDQVEVVRSLVKERSLEVAEEVPIILMRLESIKGRAVKDILGSGAADIPNWTLRRDYWSTYRGHTIESEEVVAGSFTSKHGGEGSIPISLEEKLAQNLGVSLGDELVWDIQGVLIKTHVGSLRKVFWERMRRNAFVVFPEGVLEDAPKFLFFTVRTEDAHQTAGLQREVVQALPNVSLIDIRTVVERIRGLLEKIIFVATFLATTLASTALVALFASLTAGREGRQKEAGLYRIIGATRRQITAIMRAEFLSLSAIAATASMVLSLIIHLILGRFVFRFFSPVPWGSLLLVSLLYVVIVLVIAQTTHIALLRRPSLEGVREE